MHRDPERVIAAVLPEFCKGLCKVAPPVERADRVGGKRDEIRGYAEKEETVLCIVLQNLKKARKIGSDRGYQAFLRIGGKPECL
jgi:hypothetical protein